MKNKSKASINRRTKKRNKIIKCILLAIFAILLIVAITFVTMFYFYQKQGKQSLMPELDNSLYQEQIEYDGHLYQYNKDVVAFAFIGVDQRELEKVENTEFVGANDTNIVVAINTVSGEVTLIAIPRETVVDIDIYQKGEYLGTEQNRLALAYAYGDGAQLSCQNTIDAMSRVLKNVPIQKYYAMDLDGIAALNDAIGGVILKSQYDLPEYDIQKDRIVTLKGSAAESYVRARSMTDIDGSLDRSQRQMQYIHSFVDQALPAVMMDFGKINDLYNVGAKYSQTNMDVREVIYLSALLRSKGTNNFDSILIDGTMRVEQDSAGEGMVHGLYTPDEDFVMQTVLDAFYLRIS